VSRWATRLAFAACAGVIGWQAYQLHDARTLVETVQRQRSGDLTKVEEDLLAAKAQIAQLQSRMQEPSALAGKISRAERAQVKRNRLEVDSYTSATATLKGEASGGVLAYPAPNTPTPVDWWDPLHRFHLAGDLSRPGSLRFTYTQQFEVRAVVLRQVGGGLRVETLHLYELGPHGERIGEAAVDLDRSTFEFAPPLLVSEPPPNHWLMCLDSEGEALVTWVPLWRAAGHVGVGISGGGSGSHQFLGGTVMFAPSAWYRSGFSVGASVGWSPQGRGATWRVQVALALDRVFKGG